MLTRNEQRMLERLGRMMKNMNDMQKAQLCAFTEGLAMALEDEQVPADGVGQYTGGSDRRTWAWNRKTRWRL